MPAPIVTLTTDFGQADHFVGALKGVILSMAPRACIVDITHDVAPYAVLEAAFVVAEASKCFPKGTVHVVVVDPGVGTARRALLVEAGGQYFVAPDNGVLSLVCARGKHKVRVVTAERYFRRPVSRTFHARDVFAPVAAHLLNGLAPARFGKLTSGCVTLDIAKPTLSSECCWRGHILKVDRFGNLITSFGVTEFPGLEAGSFELRAGRRKVTTCLRTYAEARPGTLFLVAGSAGYWEVAANQASAAKLTGCASGTEVQLTLRGSRP